MPRIVTSVALLGCFVALASAHPEASDPSAVQPSNGSSTSGARPGLAPEAEHAYFIARRNRARQLPTLAYWGVGAAEWGMNRSELGEALSGAWLNLEYTCTYQFDSQQRLESVQWLFKDLTQGSGDLDAKRRAFVEQYRRLERGLTVQYGGPTHPARALEGSPDPYLNGVTDGYDIEWRGLETDLSLRLSDHGCRDQVQKVGTVPG